MEVVVFFLLKLNQSPSRLIEIVLYASITLLARHYRLVDIDRYSRSRCRRFDSHTGRHQSHVCTGADRPLVRPGTTPGLTDLPRRSTAHLASDAECATYPSVLPRTAAYVYRLCLFLRKYSIWGRCS